VAFKIQRKPKERIELVSLIDMVFILLVFFMVTSFAIRMPMEERGLSIPAPENALGRAQIVIQFIDENDIFWMDETSASVVEEIEQYFGYLSPERLKNKIINDLIAQNRVSLQVLNEKINNLRMRAAQDPFARFFVLIRCPNHIPYFQVIDVITKLSDTPYRNIRYGCVGGTLNQIRECRRIYTVVEEDAQGNRRKNIRIDL
jgi:biopolymer transport protein ExbD